MNQKVIDQANVFANEATKVVFETGYGTFKAVYQVVVRRKFVVIVESDRQVKYDDRDWQVCSGGGVVCFIDGETGDVFKPEGAAPAKTKRYNVVDNVEQMIVNFKYGGNNGGFMYQDFKNIKIERKVA